MSLAGSQDSLPQVDQANESLLEQQQDTTQIGPTKKWSRTKGIRVMVVSCIVFACAVTIALIVDIHVGDHHTGHAAIATDVQECSDIGLELMKKGGSAVDAAIGALLCVGVMNPEASGIGGGGFILVATPKHGGEVIDFREVAPKSATRDMFKKNASLARQGGLAVAIPGEIKGLELAHKIYGKLKWSDVIKPAIKLARDGFTVSEHTAKVLTWNEPREIIKKDKNLMEMFAPNGQFLKAGAKVKNLKLAKTLSEIAQHGSKALYEGPIAQSIVNAVKARNGNITLSDLKNYRVIKEDCMNSEYQGYQILTAPLPAGGPVVTLMLNILEQFNFTKDDQGKNSTYQYLVEAFKFAFAQRTYLGDPLENNAVKNFTKKMISKKFASEIHHKIFSNRTFLPSYYLPSSEVVPNKGTSHVSAVGPDGEVVSVTSSINRYFGSSIMTDTGIILNNEMADFSIKPPYNKSNSVRPGKKPLSSCSPVIVRHKKDPCIFRLAIGASGGTHIPTALVQALINILSFGDSLKDAVERPRFHHQLIPNKVEAEGPIFKKYKQSYVIDFLKKVGHVVQTSGGGFADVNVAENYHENPRAHSDSRRGGSGSALY